jgi:NAD(P)-dependent dehydrogenase (short-subunit alcohol dehydrogenase family)
VDTSDLHGKRVLVTGAGSGIGRAIALLAASRGADVVVCDVDAAGLAETEARAQGGAGSVLARTVDVADREQMRAFADAVHQDGGAVDLLVNNAGVGLAARALESELEDWDWIVSINLMGVVHGVHFFVPAMVDAGRGGHVVNLSSLAGYLATSPLAAYSATKFAVLGFSEALRAELFEYRIGVTAVCPGVINTPITTNTRARGAADDPALRERTVKLYQRRNYGPDRVARNVFKAIDRNRGVAPISPESWVAYGIKRTSPRFAGFLARKIGDSAD